MCWLDTRPHNSGDMSTFTMNMQIHASLTRLLLFIIVSQWLLGRHEESRVWLILARQHAFSQRCAKSHPAVFFKPSCRTFWGLWKPLSCWDSLTGTEQPALDTNGLRRAHSDSFRRQERDQWAASKLRCPSHKVKCRYPNNCPTNSNNDPPLSKTGSKHTHTREPFVTKPPPNDPWKMAFPVKMLDLCPVAEHMHKIPPARF